MTMIRMRRATVIAALAVALSGGGLVGCASGTGYDQQTAGALQERVLAVTESAAASDFPTTLTRIAELRTAADAALAAGEISEERYASINSAADLVQADADTAIAAAAAAQAEQERLAEEAAAAEAQRVADEQAAEAAEAERQRIAQEQAAENEKGKGRGGEKDDKDDDDD